MTKIEKDVERDYFMSAEEAKKYGLIDEMFTHKGRSLPPVKQVNSLILPDASEFLAIVRGVLFCTV